MKSSLGIYFLINLSAVWVSASELETIADNFVWAENLVCDSSMSLFWVSDTTMGTLSKVYYDEKLNSYTTEVHLTGLEGLNGLALDKTGQHLYGAAAVKNETNGNKEFVVIDIDKNAPNSFTIIAHLSKAGNGVAADWTSGLLYVTTEGNFLPGEGEVYEVNPTNGNVRDYVSKLYAADGAYIDQSSRLLYVSQVIGSKVMVYDLSWPGASKYSAVPLREIEPEGVTMLDDFTLTPDGKSIIGADFRDGNVVQFSLSEGSSPVSTILASGLTSPSSARLGCDSVRGFPDSSVFITEGGGMTRRADTRRVLKLGLGEVVH